MTDPNSPTPTDASGPASTDAATAVPPAPNKPIVDWLRKQGLELLRRSWRLAYDVARYYWAIRQPLWQYIIGFLPDLASESVRARTVRLNPDESHRSAEFDSDGWKIVIPGRCVVCGNRSPNPTTDETRLVDDAARAFWMPAAGLLLGLSIGWFLFGRWFALFAWLAGFAAGYLMRSKVPVLLRMCRCEAHQTRYNIPMVLAWGNTLVLRFGDKAVRKVFLYGETIDFIIPQPDALGADIVTPPARPESDPVPETIPLADAPDPAKSQITHDAPPTFGTENEKPSPLVP